MANPLTGDFDVVMQVSGATINRLLATMHQNDGRGKDLPTFPHSVGIRIGDPDPVDGMRGTAWAQVSVPRLELIHGADDRFNLEVGIRARYKPDPGTTPLPEFIHGTVRAQYQLVNIDPNCWGWRKDAADHLWIRVVGSTVSFDGTALDDSSPFTVTPPSNPAADDARITRLAWYLLKNRFEATPQKVERRFRRGSMRSLNVGVNRSVVSVALVGQGQLTSVTQDLLDGADFGVAISGASIVARIQPELDKLASEFQYIFRFRHRTTFVIDWVTVDISWRVGISQATAQWSGGTLPLVGNVGIITVKIVGYAHTSKTALNLDFDVIQIISVSMDGESFKATPLGPPTINLSGTFASVVAGRAKPEIAAQITPRIKAEADKLSGQLHLASLKTDLKQQLCKLDDEADALFGGAVFSPDGVIVRGQISLSPRRPPFSQFARTADEDGFNGFESWIPGGRIDALEWSWTWFNSWSGAPGSEKDTDRFLLRRPPGTERGRFGVVKGLTRPLPVLDGFGTMCLRVRGVHVHPVTGELVPVASGRKCVRAGFDMRVQGVGGLKLKLREWASTGPEPDGRMQEISVVDVGGGRATAGVNTLVVFVGERWDRDVGTMLRDGLASSQRKDAGLMVLVLFRDGALANLGSDAAADLVHLARDLDAPLQVNEDVGGHWAEALVDSDGGETALGLITPTGGVSWAHRGRLESRELAQVLDGYLFPAGVPTIEAVVPGLVPGTRLPASALEAGWFNDLPYYFETDKPCPPPPAGRLGVDSRAVFVQVGSTASERVLKHLAREHEADGEQRPFVAVVVDGSAAQAERLKEGLPEDFVVIPDPDGTVSSRFSIRAWPTSVTVEQGIVTAVDVGAPTGATAPDSDTDAAS